MFRSRRTGVLSMALIHGDVGRSRLGDSRCIHAFGKEEADAQRTLYYGDDPFDHGLSSHNTSLLLPPRCASTLSPNAHATLTTISSPTSPTSQRFGAGFDSPLQAFRHTLRPLMRRLLHNDQQQLHHCKVSARESTDHRQIRPCPSPPSPESYRKMTRRSSATVPTLPKLDVRFDPPRFPEFNDDCRRCICCRISSICCSIFSIRCSSS